MASPDVTAGHAGVSRTRQPWSVPGRRCSFGCSVGYETYALLLAIGSSRHELSPAGELSALTHVAAVLISMMLLGWEAGGVLGGFIRDRGGHRSERVIGFDVVALLVAHDGQHQVRIRK